MRFTKMEGLGNAFVVVLGPQEITPALVREQCINSDGFLMVTPIDNTHIQMDYWNSDGSVAEMCGNGLRCVVRFAVDNKLVKPGNITVKTLAGNLKAIWDGKDPSNIEVQVGKVSVAQKTVVIDGREFYLASVGNPHAITFVDDVDTAHVTSLGPIIETDQLFPNKTNVEFAQIITPNKIKLRIWERGVGETKACGTGMVATAMTIVKHKNGKLPMHVEVPGGEAKIWLDDASYARMLAPANYL